jgi:hypothetical protein
MRVESRVFSLSWLPSDVVTGVARVPLSIGLARADAPPPEVVADPQALVAAGSARQANDLHAWAEFGEDGRPTSWNYGDTGDGEARLGQLDFPLLRLDPEIDERSVRFVQTAGGRLGGSVPHRVVGKPFFRFDAPVAWTTLALTLASDGSSRGELIGSSPFPRHWIYGDDGGLLAKSAEVDYRRWLEQASSARTPWGVEESRQFVTAAESALERRLSARIMGARPRVRTVSEGTMLVEQGDRDDNVFLVLDGVLDVDVGGQTVAEVGPGAIIGERASLEGRRSATLRARTACRVVALDPELLSSAEREQIAAAHRREDE